MDIKTRVSDLELSEITIEEIESVKKEWLSIISKDIPEELVNIAQRSYEGIISWVVSGINQNSCGNCGFFVLKSTSQGNYPAIIEMTDATRAKDPSFKLLNIHFRPNLSIEYKDNITAADITEITIVLIAAISMSVKTAFIGGNKFKIFGRTREMLTMFETMLASNNGTDKDFSVYQQGKWLVFEPTKK